MHRAGRRREEDKYLQTSPGNLGYRRGGGGGGGLGSLRLSRSRPFLRPMLPRIAIYGTPLPASSPLPQFSSPSVMSAYAKLPITIAAPV